MNHLPPEIVACIVSELTPMDCNECFQVSRHWRHIIPEAASQPFQDITVDDSSLRVLASIDLVGHLVKTARLKFEPMTTMIKVMDRLQSCSLLQKLELRSVNIIRLEVMQAKLKSCIEKWRLDTLALVNIHAPAMNLVDYILLATKHNVSHFAFSCGDEGSHFHVKRQLLECRNLSTLVSLVIDNPADIHPSDIKELLSFAPNLEYLELATCYKDDTFMSDILTLCPKIIHIHLSLHYLTTDEEEIHPKDYLQLAASYDHRGSPGLRCYWNRVTDCNQAGCDMVLKHQSTLESVCLGDERPSSSFAPNWETFNTRLLSNNTTLKRLVIPLYRRHIGSLQYEDGYSFWLNTCQALEHLELLYICHAFGGPMIHTLQYKLPSLRRIDIEFTKDAVTASQLKLLQALHDRCNHTETLKELQLSFRGGHHNYPNTIEIIYTALTIRTLERLTVECCNTLQEWDTLAFINQLRTSLPRLTYLGLGCFSTLSVEVIHALATLNRLASLAFLYNEDITITEVEAESLILTMGNNLKRLYFVYCDLSDGTKAYIESLSQTYAVECIISNY